MDTKGQDQGLPYPGLRDRRLPGRPRMLRDATGKAQDEPAESTRLLTAERVNAGGSLPAERQKAAIGSFEPLIDSANAAELLKVHRKTLERMALRGEVPGHKVGKFWRFRCSELDAWWRSRVQSGRQPCCATEPTF
jgi:excisionase family DNA binding protein